MFAAADDQRRFIDGGGEVRRRAIVRDDGHVHWVPIGHHLQHSRVLGRGAYGQQSRAE